MDEFAAEYARQQDEERRMFIAAGTTGRVRTAAAKKIARGEGPMTRQTTREKQEPQQPKQSDGGWRLYSQMREHGLDSPQH